MSFFIIQYHFFDLSQVGIPAKLKHISQAEEKKTTVIPLVVAIERGTAQTVFV